MDFGGWSGLISNTGFPSPLQRCDVCMRDQALLQVLAAILPVFSCRGFCSQSGVRLDRVPLLSIRIKPCCTSLIVTLSIGP